jgi:hypothetical protein
MWLARVGTNGSPHHAQARWRFRVALASASPCYNASMTDRPASTPPRPPLRLPPNFRDVTAEKVGTVIGISGATAAKATKPG